MKAVILKNDISNSADRWIEACKKYTLPYSLVDLTTDEWVSQIETEQPALLLACPPALNESIKRMYDEKIALLTEKGYHLYPQLHEIKLHENKRYLSYWLKMNDIPHPSTHIFYSKQEAFLFLENASFPLVAKLNIGASGRGIKILKNRNSAKEYVTRIFNKGISSAYGPNLKKANKFRRAFHALTHPSHLASRLNAYKAAKDNIQKGFVLFQEYIRHEYEWRIVVIGDSYFGHKKVRVKDMASGSLVKKYDDPPETLLTFVKSLVDKHQFRSAAFDVFELENEHYLINEIQCIFGQSDPHQMMINNRPGRYIYKTKWIFEEGEFNTNESYDLRLSDAMSFYNLD